MAKHENSYYFSEDSFFNILFALPISKHFCWKKQLNTVTRRFFEAGLFSEHLKDEQLQFKLKKKSLNVNESRAAEKLRISDLKGVFLILISGYIIGLIILFVEVAVKYFVSKKVVVAYL